MGLVEFIIDTILRTALRSKVDTNDYQGYLLGGKGDWCVELTTLSSSGTYGLEIKDSSIFGSPKNLSRPVERASCMKVTQTDADRIKLNNVCYRPRRRVLYGLLMAKKFTSVCHLDFKSSEIRIWQVITSCWDSPNNLSIGLWFIMCFCYHNFLSTVEILFFTLPES